ncbi:MAG: hypothetical protein AAB401_10085 [Acidobacteriota bacterium]
MRWMSPVEYARLQGVPDFNIQRTRNQALTGFADAVCVPAIDWIARHTLNHSAAHLGYSTSAAKIASQSQIPLRFDDFPVAAAAVRLT